MAHSKREVQAIVFNKHGIGHMARVERFPKPGETIRAIEWRFDEDGGKGTNVAVALGLLGVKSALICKVGQDGAGRTGEKWLKAADVDLTHYIMSPEISTDVGVVITQADGENMIIGSPGHACCLSAEELFAAIDDYPQAQYFLSGLEIDPKLPLEGCRYAYACGKTTMLNLSPLMDELEGSLEYVDYLFVNELEAEQLAGVSCAEADSRAIAQCVWERYRPGAVVMTLGDKGCVVCERGEADFFPSYDVACIDSVAAGDGFMAAFTFGIIQGMTNQAAADWANRYSAVVVSRKGSILSYPTLKEVHEISGGLHTRRMNGGT